MSRPFRLCALVSCTLLVCLAACGRAPTPTPAPLPSFVNLAAPGAAVQAIGGYVQGAVSEPTIASDSNDSLSGAPPAGVRSGA